MKRFENPIWEHSSSNNRELSDTQDNILKVCVRVIIFWLLVLMLLVSYADAEIAGCNSIFDDASFAEGVVRTFGTNVNNPFVNITHNEPPIVCTAVDGQGEYCGDHPITGDTACVAHRYKCPNVFNVWVGPGSQHCPSGDPCPPGWEDNGVGGCSYADTNIQFPKENGMPETACLGNPINPATGNKFQIETDITSSDRLTFSRYYNSIKDEELGTIIIEGKWTFDYFQSLKIYTNVTTNLYFAFVNRQDGKKYQFTCSELPGPCSSDTDVKLTLDKTINGYTLLTENNITENYDTDGKLLSITDLSGRTQTLSYNVGNGLLETVTDFFGKTLVFTHDVNKRLETVSDPDGDVYTYIYNATTGNLESVIYPDDTPGTSTDNPKREYLYNNPNFDSLLTAIIDENGNIFSEWAYDAQGRAVMSKYAGGAEQVNITYNSNGTVNVTDSLGASNIYSFEVHAHSNKLSSISGGQCGSGCSNQGQAQTYDVNGFLASRTDFEGNVTTFINNSRGLQTSRTEAVGTPEERTITTEWHPTFRLPTKIAEPGKETLFTYDAQGRLLTRSEREL